MNNELKTLSIIIPALNEEEGVGLVIKSIPFRKIKKMGYEVEVLVVDNNSSDNTAIIAKNNGANVITASVRGYGNAYKIGFANAKGEIIVTGDADLTYPFEVIPKLLLKIEREKLDFINTDRLTNLNKTVMPRLQDESWEKKNKYNLEWDGKYRTINRKKNIHKKQIMIEQFMRFVWESGFSVGVNKFDEQHKQFFEITNKIYDMVSENSINREELFAQVLELESYATYHLLSEEEIFYRYKYPQTEKHLEAHNFYRQEIQEYVEKCMSNDVDLTNLAAELADFASSWLLEHIKSVDKQYSDFLIGKNVE